MATDRPTLRKGQQMTKHRASDIEALRKVRDDLCAGRIKAESFDMSEWHCGSVGCIGGWAEQLYQPDLTQRVELMSDDNPLNRLFYPHCLSTDWSTITTCQAIKAIDNFLETGHPNWRKVMKDAP